MNQRNTKQKNNQAVLDIHIAYALAKCVTDLKSPSVSLYIYIYIAAQLIKTTRKYTILCKSKRETQSKIERRENKLMEF